MADLKLFLLGPPRIELDGAPVEIQRRKALALLGYLAVSGQTHSRDALATLFYPEHPQSRARAYLRRDLANLNSGLDGAWLAADRDAIELKRGYWLDVAQFRQHLADCQSHDHPPQAICSECLPPLTEAAALYSDHFLAGFTLRDSPDFDDWQFFQAENLRQELASVLARLVQLLSDRAEYALSISHARRWVALDPLHEPAQRNLIQLYDRAGQLAAAIRQYEEYAQLLEQELGLPPEEETTTLYEAIKAKRILAPHLKPEDRVNRTAPAEPVPASRDQSRSGKRATDKPADVSAETVVLPEPPISAPPVPRHNLPAQATPFIGRERELAEIRRLLLDEPDCRLLTLIGPGGIGKSRLALEAAGVVVDHFPDGVYFVPLAAVSEPQFVVPAIVEALSLNLHGGKEPKDQLFHYLSDKQLLLVTDNFEHLIASVGNQGSVDQLAEILRIARGVKLLVTSQQRLHLQEEWGFEVHGLGFPTDFQPASANGQPVQVREQHDIETYGAVRFFLQAARRTEASFTLTAEDIPAVVRLCQLVDGMPLGLELAATWVRSMSCQEIVQEIERNFDFLTTSMHNLPERHRSLRVVFEQSWQRLSPPEQQVLSRLSVFRGGCHREAAETVAGATLSLLSVLVDKTLLHRTANGRYALHDLICQFALEQLKTDPQAYEQVQALHGDYYTSFLQQQAEYLKGRRQKEALAEIATDIDNVRVAWRWAVDRQDAVALEKAATGWWLFSELRGMLHEGEVAFGQAAAALTTPAKNRSATSAADNKELFGFLLAGQGYLSAQRGRLKDGRVLMERGLDLIQQAEQPDRSKEAFARLWLAWVLLIQGKYAEAKLAGQGSLAYFTEIEDRWGLASCFLMLGAVAYRQGQLAEAEQLLEGCLVFCQEIDEQGFGYWARLNLALVGTMVGEYTRAQQLLAEALEISQELDHPIGIAYAQRELGNLAIIRGEYEQAVQIIQQSVSILEALGSSWYVGSTLNYFGSAYRLQGDHEQAERLFYQSLEAAKAVGHRRYMALALSNLGCLAYDRAEYYQAEQFQQEALAIWRELDHQPELAAVLRNLGQIAAAAGGPRQPEASDYFRQALKLALEHRLAPVALDVILGLAGLLAAGEQSPRAVELASLVEQHPASSHQTRAEARRQLAELAGILPADEFAAAKSRSRTLAWPTTARQIIEEAGTP